MTARDHLRRAAELLDEAVAELYEASKKAERTWRPEIRTYVRAAMALANQIVDALSKLA